MAAVRAALLLLFLSARGASGSYPRAQNVTWESTNFKTILSWEPQSSEDFSYTVEFSAVGQDTQRNLHCIRSSAPRCDLSASLTDIRACYAADVISEPPLGAVSDLIEFPPHSRSPRFCPYNHTGIGQPEFKLEVSEELGRTTLYVSDPLTALFNDGRQLNVRDVFSDQLQYKVTYQKHKSTGKKERLSSTNVVELDDLDRGESYCFQVQAYIPSRSVNYRLGMMSGMQCSADRNPSIFKEYSLGVIAAAIFLVLLLIGIVIAVIVTCRKYRKNAAPGGKEGQPLHDV